MPQVALLEGKLTTGLEQKARPGAGTQGGVTREEVLRLVSTSGARTKPTYGRTNANKNVHISTKPTHIKNKTKVISADLLDFDFDLDLDF